MPSMVLCAGFGTRLRPLSEWLPKALMPVGDRPALAHMLERVRAVPGPIVVNAHHRADDLRSFLAGYAPDVHLSHEVEILGTAGGVRHARPLLGAGDVLVWNGDILAPIDVAAMVRAHRADATLAVHLGAVHTGNVGVDAEGRIVRLRGETVRGGEVRGGEFAAVHVVGARLVGSLGERGCLVGDVYLPALRDGAHLDAFSVGPWREIGSVASYLAANVAWLAERGISQWIARTARVGAGVKLERSVVGEGAEVVGEGPLERCVVWPGGRAVAPLVDTVVAPEGLSRLATT